MSHIIFRVRLVCANCGFLNDERSNRLYTWHIGHEAGDTHAIVGDELQLERSDFEDGYFSLHHPSDEVKTVVALELWGCKHCLRVQAARLRFAFVDQTHWRFVEAEPVPLSRSELEAATYISRRLEEWAPNPGDDGDRMHDVLRRFGLSACPARPAIPVAPTARTRAELLEAWTRSARPLAELCAEVAKVNAMRDPDALADLAIQAARSVLVNPDQNLGEISGLIDPLTAAEAPVARLAVLDLVHALQCAGATLRPELEAHVRRRLAELAVVGPPLALRMHVAFSALAYGELDLAATFAPELPSEFFSGLTFPNNVLSLLGYLVFGARAGAVPGTLAAAWSCVVDELAELCASGQLDEPSILWLARVLHEHFGGQPAASVAALAHDQLWSHREARPSSEKPAFPLTDTLDHGAYRVERHLLGLGGQNLWLGQEITTGVEVLVACDWHNPDKQNVAELRRLVAYQIAGIFEFAYVGPFDITGTDPQRDALRSNEWAMVEKVTAGSWLPRILGPADPWKAPAKALSLGRSAGHILLRAYAAGLKLARIRPELMWADRRDGQLVVTGLSPRATELFARKVGEMVTFPVFDRFYYAPEIHRDTDDRSIAYSLAVMIAEWATGRHPFELRDPYRGVQTARHLPIAAPRPLAALLESTIRLDRNERPSLATFVAALDQLML